MSTSSRNIAVIILALLSGLASAKEPDVWHLTPEHFRDTTTVKDSPLDTTAMISTVSGYVEKHGLLRMVWNDNFLRAFIDKKTHRITYQVYQVIYYDGGGWRFYSTVNYQSPTGLQTAELTRIDQQVLDCSGVGAPGCSYVEHVGFDVDEGLLRLLAAGYVPDAKNVWVFKFSGRTTDGDVTDGIAFAEIAGFMQKVDDYVHGLPAIQAQATAVPLAPGQKLRLGVQFVALPPAAAQTVALKLV